MENPNNVEIMWMFLATAAKQNVRENAKYGIKRKAYNVMVAPREIDVCDAAAAAAKQRHHIQKLIDRNISENESN